jgi:hypothetical protein
VTDPYEELVKPSPLLDRLKRANPLMKLLESDGPPTPAFPLGWSKSQDANVVIAMTPDDWEALILTLGYAGQFIRSTDGAARFSRHLALLNRLNAGNPSWTPYEIAGEPE